MKLQTPKTGDMRDHFPLKKTSNSDPEIFCRGSQLASRTSGPLSICDIESVLIGIGFDFKVDIAESYWESRTSVTIFGQQLVL